MTIGQLNSIIAFFVSAVPSRESFKQMEDQLFQSLQKKHGITRAEFSKKLAEKLSDPSFKHGLSNDQLIELAHRVNSYPVYLAIAKKLPMEMVRKEFPTLKKKVELAAEQAPVGTSFTSTANTGPYPVPIGKRMLRRKQPKVS